MHSWFSSSFHHLSTGDLWYSDSSIWLGFKGGKNAWWNIYFYSHGSVWFFLSPQCVGNGLVKEMIATLLIISEHCNFAITWLTKSAIPLSIMVLIEVVSVLLWSVADYSLDTATQDYYSEFEWINLLYIFLTFPVNYTCTVIRWREQSVPLACKNHA